MDDGLLGGLGQGLQNAFQMYVQQRNRQDDLKRQTMNDAFNKKLQKAQLFEKGIVLNDPEDKETLNAQLENPQAAGNGLLASNNPTDGSQFMKSNGMEFAPWKQKDIELQQDVLKHKGGDEELDRLYKKAQISKLLHDSEKEKEPSGDQFKAAGFAKRMENSGAILNQKTGIRSSNMGALQSMLPNIAQSADLQQVDQAERDFLNAVLRRESGAAISPSEFANGARQYFERAGDSPEVKAQKTANRDQVIANLRTEGSRAYKKIPSTGLLQPQNGLIQGSSMGAAPKAGMVESGYKFLGGDPANPKSWEKVK